jgi:hypothetical protein
MSLQRGHELEHLTHVLDKIPPIDLLIQTQSVHHLSMCSMHCSLCHETNLMQYLSTVYFINKPPHVSDFF